MGKTCDHTSVGVIIHDQMGSLALLKRAIFPVGIAPAAGHIDDHGSPEQAAKDEVFEELGIKLSELSTTTISNRRVDNACSREGGDHHNWYVYEAIVSDATLKPSDEETKGAAWYDLKQLQKLAARTKAYQNGTLPENEWQESPGIETVWVPFLEELGYITPED